MLVSQEDKQEAERLKHEAQNENKRQRLAGVCNSMTAHLTGAWSVNARVEQMCDIVGIEVPQVGDYIHLGKGCELPRYLGTGSTAATDGFISGNDDK